MDVSEPTVRVDVPPVQPVPTCHEGGRSGTSSGSRTSEMNTGDRERKRVKFAESRGQKRQGEGVEELAANAEEQHLDADVEVRADKTYRAEDVAWDAAAAAPEQLQTAEISMNRGA